MQVYSVPVLVNLPSENVLDSILIKLNGRQFNACYLSSQKLLGEDVQL